VLVGGGVVAVVLREQGQGGGRDGSGQRHHTEGKNEMLDGSKKQFGEVMKKKKPASAERKQAFEMSGEDDYSSEHASTAPLPEGTYSVWRNSAQ
jgi:hypothetical protein